MTATLRPVGPPSVRVSARGYTLVQTIERMGDEKLIEVSYPVTCGDDGKVIVDLSGFSRAQTLADSTTFDRVFAAANILAQIVAQA